MLENMKFKSSNNAGSWAAAYLIFAVALVGMTFVSVLAFQDHPEAGVWVLGVGGGLGLLTLVLRVRPELPSECLWLFTRGRRATSPDYVPRIIKPTPVTTFGTNRPPTAEEIRDLKDTPRNWVPSQSRSGRKSLRRRA